MKPAEYARFEKTATWMEAKASEWGLQPFPMRYEICPADVVYSVAGFGMPTRFQHWSFGKHYHRQKLSFDYGLSRIYELVVNNDPCYAFFLDTNTILQNEMIVAHVLGHSDFFRNNRRFMQTNRDMVETMAGTAERFQEYEDRYGIARVEQVIDSVLAIDRHIDPSLYIPSRIRVQQVGTDFSSYDRQIDKGTSVRNPSEPASDLLFFLLQNGNHLEPWEKDIIASVRDEMLYFWPQIETKIMNEGWATYWHTKFMQEMDLGGEDAIEFAKMTATVAQPNRYQLNPYNVGLAIWRDIERRYGTEEMFIVRETDSDTSFLRNYLTQEIVDECDLYVYEQRGNEWVVIEKEVDAIRAALVQERVHGGFPVLQVHTQIDHGRSVLHLTHAYEGVELDEKYIRKTLPHVYRLWGEEVCLNTVMDDQETKYVYDGKNLTSVKVA